VQRHRFAPTGSALIGPEGQGTALNPIPRKTVVSRLKLVARPPPAPCAVPLRHGEANQLITQQTLAQGGKVEAPEPKLTRVVRVLPLPSRIPQPTLAPTGRPIGQRQVRQAPELLPPPLGALLLPWSRVPQGHRGKSS